MSKLNPQWVYPPAGTVVMYVLVCGIITASSPHMHLMQVNDVCDSIKQTSTAKPASVLFIGNFLVVCVFSLAAGLQTRNAVVYDEVVLSPTTTSSSVIPTEPNTAYVTTTIPTDQNVAYAVHSSS